MPSKYGYRGYGAARTPGSQDRGLQYEKLSAGKMYNAKTGKFIKENVWPNAVDFFMDYIDKVQVHQTTNGR